MIVIVIIGILTTIAVSMTLKMYEKAHISSLKSDLSSAYKAALAFHLENPDYEITVDDLKDYGYRPSENKTWILKYPSSTKRSPSISSTSTTIIEERSKDPNP